MLHVYRSRGSLNLHVMKSKIKSLLAIGDILSPGKSRNTTGAKTAAVDAFGVVSSPSQKEESTVQQMTYPTLSLCQSSPHPERAVDRCSAGML